MTEPDPRDRLAWLISDPVQVDGVPPDEIPDVIGVLESVKTRLLSRLMASSIPHAQQEPSDTEDKLLKVEEAAKILSVKPKWIYEHADILPFTRRLSKRTIRCSEQSLQRWLKRVAS
jgi:predicted DNA-binding transcriptional regulator AlpA